MTRLRRLLPGGRIFFITTNLQRGLRHFSPPERDLLCETIAAVRDRRRFRLTGLVVMPDHVHVLVLPSPNGAISKIVQELKYSTSRLINARRRRRGTLWQKGFFDRFMRTPKEFLETLDYLHQNPVRKGLVTEPAAWRWSSARAYAGLGSIVPVDFLELSAEAEKRFW